MIDRIEIHNRLLRPGDAAERLGLFRMFFSETWREMVCLNLPILSGEEYFEDNSSKEIYLRVFVRNTSKSVFFVS